MKELATHSSEKARKLVITNKILKYVQIKKGSKAYKVQCFSTIVNGIL